MLPLPGGAPLPLPLVFPLGRDGSSYRGRLAGRESGAGLVMDDAGRGWSRLGITFRILVIS